ncbi:hypothetical protein ACE02Z_00320 [Shewanella xiamenensis]|uniref:hypothetical protein n=1 Tax=Shewanella xiamenensis TaxID=332186 RepID=UPI00313D5372
MKHSKPAFSPTFAKAKVNKQAQKAKAQHCCSCGCFIPFEQRNSTNACEKCAAEMAFLYSTAEQSSAQITEDYRKEHPSEDWDDEAF